MPKSLPTVRMEAMEPSGKPMPSQPSWSTESKVSTAALWMSATMVLSRP
jgi:hypothetical protein